MSARVRSANNVAIEAAVLAIARAHVRLPGVDVARVKHLAVEIDRALTGHMTAECTVALCIQLLRSIGVADPANESRLLM